MSEPLHTAVPSNVPTPPYMPPGPPPPGMAATQYGVPRGLEDEYDRQPALTPVQRVADTFFAPTKTFADIRRNTSWWLPYLLLAVFGYAFAFTALHRVGIHQMVTNMMHSNPAQEQRMANMPPEQRASATHITETITTAGLYAGPVFVLAWEAFLALLLWAGFNFLLGGRSTYPGMLAVAFFSALPTLLQTVAILVTLFVSDPENFNLASPVGTNPGYYMGPETSAGVRALLTSFDLFTIWQMLLLGIGGAIVARIKPVKGLILVAGVWLLVVLVKFGFSAATS